MQSKFISIILMPAMVLASPLAANLFRRDCTESPYCTGCGIGNGKASSQQLLDQIDLSKAYPIPWDSTMNGWTGETTDADGEPAMQAIFEDPNTCQFSRTPGTIQGDLLKSSLQALVDASNDETQRTCFSQNNQYQFFLGGGSSCGGRR